MENNTVKNNVVFTYESNDIMFPYEAYGITTSSTPEEVANAIALRLKEETHDESFDLVAEYEDGNYTIKMAENSGNIYIFPKSTAGK